MDFGNGNLFKPYLPNQLLTLQLDAQLLCISKQMHVYDIGNNEPYLSHAQQDMASM